MHFKNLFVNILYIAIYKCVINAHMVRKRRVGRPLKKRDPDTIGGRISKMRVTKNLTIARLAELTGMSPITIAFIETGKIKNPTTKSLKLLSDVLECSLAWLAFGESEREHYRPSRN